MFSAKNLKQRVTDPGTQWKDREEAKLGAGQKQSGRGWRNMVVAIFLLSLGAVLPEALHAFYGKYSKRPSIPLHATRVSPQHQNKSQRSRVESVAPTSLASPRPTIQNQVYLNVSKDMLKVTEKVVSRLKQTHEDIASGRMAGEVNDWFAAHKPLDLIKQLENSEAVLIKATLMKSCFEECLSQGRSCQPHWFDVLNECDILRVAYPEAEHCSQSFYGRDLPAYRPGDSTVLVNKWAKTYAGSCGGKHEKTERLCGCGTRKGGSTSTRTFHTIYNVQPSQYFEWQVRYMHLWFKQSGTQGHITRLLSSNGPDHLMSEIPTHVSPPYVKKGDPYLPYNKPAAVDHWLKNSMPTEDIILLIDPDCMLVNKFDAMVEEGSPIAQQAYFFFDPDADNEPMQVAKRYCHNCTFLDPIAVPIIIHRNDLAKIAPLWLEKTLEIRRDMHSWPETWVNRSLSNIGLSWTAEMFGYVFAASELGIRHDIWNLQSIPGVHTTLTTPIIHYHLEIKLPNGKIWYKHTESAGYDIPWPIPEKTDELSRITITKLHEAYSIISKTNVTNHKWNTTGRYNAEEQ